MYCSYHPQNPARVQCLSCRRQLCPACAHRIKGSPYCQDCIVMGIESLSRDHYNSHRSKGRPAAAFFLALLPGLGAVYNRQNIKAVVHFVTVVGLFQLTNLNVMEGFFVMAGMGFYFYSIIDAYRTAQKIARGESAAADEELFKKTLIKRAPMIGLLFIVTGLLLFIQILQPFNIRLSFAKLIPVALVFLGGYLLTRYFKRSREGGYTADYPDQPPYPLIPGAFSERQSQQSSRQSYPGDRR
ncbi:MAG: hypothetical protein L0229_14035 [Blastocatellia bacterium]|nr:hypothetical protein [Blastocatellia bacterium]